LQRVVDFLDRIHDRKLALPSAESKIALARSAPRLVLDWALQ
jgi:hypothetical protein